MSKPTTCEVIEAARDALDSVNRTAPGRLFVVESRDALQALLNNGGFGLAGHDAYNLGERDGAEKMRERCAKECKPTLHSSRIRDRIRNLSLRGKDE